MDNDHSTHSYKKQVDAWFVGMAEQAHEKDGVICNLSPVSCLRHFREWKPSKEPTA